MARLGTAGAGAVVALLAVAAAVLPAGGATPALAFTGAVGFGANATGGTGGSVYQVTNLNDSGSGSFRDAVGTGHRIVEFAVSGYIQLSSAVSVASDMIFDHVSVEFGQWDDVDSVGASDITVQNSIVADPIGQRFGAHSETGPYTWYHDLFANSHNRNPLAKANTQFIDNVVYDYQAGYTAGNSSGHFSHDVIGNYFIAGPTTSSPSDAYYQMNNQSVYNSGNYLDSNKDGTLNGSALALGGGATALSAPWSSTTAGIPTSSAASAYAYVVANVGAQPRDQVDSQVVGNLTSLGTSGSLWSSQTATGLGNDGYGSL